MIPGKQPQQPSPTVGDILDDIDRARRVIVEPMIEQLKTHLDTVIKPIIEQNTQQETRLKNLETGVEGLKAERHKVMAVYGVMASGLSVALAAVYGWGRDWLRTHFHW